MEEKSPQGMKVPVIVVGVAVLVIGVGIYVRSGDSPSSPPAPEPELALAEPVPLPAPSPSPNQEIKFSSLAATDNQGGAWTLGLKSVPPEPPEDGTKPGSPLCVKADVKGSGRSISIGLIIEGQAGEVYEPGAAKDGKRRPAPKFTVLDESGTVLGSGSFEYG